MRVFFILLIVVELGVKDWRDEGRGRPAETSGSGSGDVLGLILVVRLVRGAAANGGAAFDKWTRVGGSDIYIQRRSVWGQMTWLFPFT